MESIDDVSGLLKEIYKDACDWLKFAEAKNAILLSINGVFLFGVLRMCSSENSIVSLFTHTFYCMSIIIVLNMIYILYSFLPMFKDSDKSCSTCEKEKLNLLYYGDISCVKKDEYIKYLIEKYNVPKNSKDSKFINDLCAQIIDVSKVAMKKYKTFRNATYIAIFTLLIPVLKIICLFI